MKNIIFIVTIVAFANIFAQQEKLKTDFTDSAKVIYQENTKYLENTFFPNKAIPIKLTLSSHYFLQNQSIYATEFDPIRSRDELLIPLILQYQSNEKNKFLYGILSTLQTSAVAYLAYEHIRKYGLFK